MSAIEDLRNEVWEDGQHELRVAGDAIRARNRGRVEEALVLGYSAGVLAAEQALVAALRRACLDLDLGNEIEDALAEKVDAAVKTIPPFEG